MGVQNDWWLYPQTKVEEDIVEPIRDPVIALLNTLQNLALIQSQHIHNTPKVAPSLAGGVEITADATAWTLGAESDAIISGDGAKEKVELTITAACTKAGNVIVILDGAGYTIPVTNTLDTAAKVAGAIKTYFVGLADFDEVWTVGGADAVVTFEAVSEGEKKDAVYDAGETGAAGTILTTVQGYGDKPFDIHRVNFEAMSDTGTYELVLYGDGEEITRLRATKTTAVDKEDSAPVQTPVMEPGTEVTARVAYSAGGESKSVTVSLEFHTYDLSGGE